MLAFPRLIVKFPPCVRTARVDVDAEEYLYRRLGGAVADVPAAALDDKLKFWTFL